MIFAHFENVKCFIEKRIKCTWCHLHNYRNLAINICKNKTNHLSSESNQLFSIKNITHLLVLRASSLEAEVCLRVAEALDTTSVKEQAFGALVWHQYKQGLQFQLDHFEDFSVNLETAEVLVSRWLIRFSVNRLFWHLVSVFPQNHQRKSNNNNK